MTTLLPAEWAPQASVMLTWPRREGDFARWFDKVEQNFIQIALAITRFQPLVIVREGEPTRIKQQLIKAGAPAERIHVYSAPSNDVWARDHGPITVFRHKKPVHLDFQFNGWGGKFECAQDNQITERLAKLGAWGRTPVEKIDFILEGGGIESDGAGTLLTTERCLLAPTRNPQFNKAQVEEKLERWFGLKRVLWLKRGDLLGDDTDGHVDTIARFCNPTTIAYQACDDRSDAHYEDLSAMAAELAALQTPYGKPYTLVPLPLPAPIHDETGRRLPAGYANFLIINGAVLVPVYGDANDKAALELLRPAFPNREVIGIDCRPLIHQYGSLHCVTMQIPQSPLSPLAGRG